MFIHKKLTNKFSLKNFVVASQVEFSVKIRYWNIDKNLGRYILLHSELFILEKDKTYWAERHNHKSPHINLKHIIILLTFIFHIRLCMLIKKNLAYKTIPFQNISFSVLLCQNIFISKYFYFKIPSLLECLNKYSLVLTEISHTLIRRSD